ncbi:hypothetical protein EXIGLDRAFT_722384 [Exidia glandulosa HHB12029]|uniref:Uncharacterized protein n=1 Tax=Exidia glandulosa HHB12029 TaxID=1314781 RepID=A0A165FBK0_EXIGL|nr:hypothetical protein EXIGLDRAFT_722384 [Exidia glandulosa HHB12029]
MTSQDRGSTFAALNRRYARTLDGRIIRYDWPSHVVIRYDVIMTSAQRLADFVARYGRGRGARSSKETMLLRLIADRVQKLLDLWQKTIEHGPRFIGIDEELGSGVLTHQVDIDICDTLDTLTALEDAAEDMGIPGYARILMKRFTSEPCSCRSCAPPPHFLAWLLQCAHKCHPKLSPDVFERIFGELREDAAGT